MGDTRCDSVLERRDSLNIPNEIPFPKEATVFIAGSSWPEDEDCIFPGLEKALAKHQELYLILAPHEPSEDHLKNAEQYFKNHKICRWSNLENADEKPRIILIDSIGILAALYKIADLAYVGGGFTTGIHNTLEPLAMGTAISFGPKNKNSMEALQMLKLGLVTSVSNAAQFEQWLNGLLNDAIQIRKLCEASQEFIEKQAGAADRCLPYLWPKL